MFLWQQAIHTLSSQNTTANLLCQLFNQLAVCCCVYLSLPTTSILVTMYRQSSSCCFIITQVSKHHTTTTLHSTVPATNSHCLETFLCTLHNKNGTQHDGKKWRLFLALWLAVYDINSEPQSDWLIFTAGPIKFAVRTVPQFQQWYHVECPFSNTTSVRMWRQGPILQFCQQIPNQITMCALNMDSKSMQKLSFKKELLFAAGKALPKDENLAKPVCYSELMCNRCTASNNFCCF